jgi:hypothetical protein
MSHEPWTQRPGIRFPVGLTAVMMFRPLRAGDLAHPVQHDGWTASQLDPAPNALTAFTG